MFNSMATKRRGRPPGGSQRTRERIVEATVALHEEVGPAATTISAIAERAGVQRLTVYRHFGEERALLAACSAHWTERHPFPPPSQWAAEPDPGERVGRALGTLYAWYRDGSRMLARVLADEAESDPLSAVMEPYHAWQREVAGSLAAGWGVRGDGYRRLRAAVGHAIAFGTWRSLADQGLEAAEAAALMASFVAGAAADAGAAS